MTESLSKPGGAMDINRIREIIPHRYPFLLVDRVLEIDFEKQRLVAVKNITYNEPQFTGHYPHLPVMPGVLLIEAMAQAAAVYMLSLPGNAGKTPLFTGIDEVKFRRMVVPGDQFRMVIQVTRLKSRVARCDALGEVEGEKAVEAKLTCMLVDPGAQTQV